MSPRTLTGLSFLTLALTLASTAFAGGSRFYLPNELRTRPDHYADAKAATVRLCAGQACGTAFFISNSGYLLTAKHVVAEMKPGYGLRLNGNPEIPELAGSGTVRIVHISSGIDYALLKFTPKERGPLDGQALACIPRADATQPSRSAVWGIGFPGAVFPADSDYYSDGLREMTTQGMLYHAHPSDHLDAPVTGYAYGLIPSNKDKIYFTNATASPGMSGGPMINSRGEHVGVISAVSRPWITDAARLASDPYQSGVAIAFRTSAVYEELRKLKGPLFANPLFDCEHVGAPASPNGRRHPTFGHYTQYHADEILRADQSLGGIEDFLTTIYKRLLARPELTRLHPVVKEILADLQKHDRLSYSALRVNLLSAGDMKLPISRDDIYPVRGLAENAFRHMLRKAYATGIIQTLARKTRDEEITQKEWPIIANELSEHLAEIEARQR